MKNKAVYKKWIEGDGLEQVCEWARFGMSDKQIAKNMGVTSATLYDWKKKFPSFAEAVDRAKTELKIELEKSMLDLAIGKVYVEEIKTILDPNNGTVIRVEKTRKQIPPSANVQQFLAKNLMPEKYHPPCWDNDSENNGGGINNAQKSQTPLSIQGLSEIG